KSIWFGHILSGRAEGGYGFGFGDERLPVYERFYLGGPNSIRSFKARQISPKDEFGTRIGGTSEVLGNVEYLIPLPFDIRLAAITVLVSGTAAQQPAPAPAPAAAPAPAPATITTKIGYIDVQRVLARSAAGVAAREQLEKERGTIQKDMDGRRQELEKLRDE